MRIGLCVNCRSSNDGWVRLFVSFLVVDLGELPRDLPATLFLLAVVDLYTCYMSLFAPLSTGLLDCSFYAFDLVVCAPDLGRILGEKEQFLSNSLSYFNCSRLAIFF